MTKIQVISELLEQYQNVSGYQAYLESIQTQYEQMKDSSFYEGRPYAEAQGKKTTEDFAKLQGTEPEIGMNWGVEADGGTNLIRNSYFIGARYLYCFGISGSHI